MAKACIEGHFFHSRGKICCNFTQNDSAIVMGLLTQILEFAPQQRITSMHEIQKTPEGQGTCILDGYHACIPGEMEIWIRYDDETFEKNHHFFLGHDIMMVSRRVSYYGASPQAMQGSLSVMFLTAMYSMRWFWGEVFRRRIFLLRERVHHTEKE